MSLPPRLGLGLGLGIAVRIGLTLALTLPLPLTLIEDHVCRCGRATQEEYLRSAHHLVGPRLGLGLGLGSG